MKDATLDLAREILADPDALRQGSTARGTSPEALEHQEDMTMLRELTRMSMDAARLLHGRMMAAEAAASEPAAAEPAVIAAAQAFSHMARTVRQCVALRNRLGDDHKKRADAELKLRGQVMSESRETALAERHARLDQLAGHKLGRRGNRREARGLTLCRRGLENPRQTGAPPPPTNPFLQPGYHRRWD
jgi:hypothetical protein